MGFDYLYAATPANTYGKCVSVDENRVIIGGQQDSTTRGYHKCVYSDAGDASTGYAENYFFVGSPDQDIIAQIPSRAGHVTLKERSTYLKSSRQPDGITDSQWNQVLYQISDIKTASAYNGNIYILTYGGFGIYTGSSFEIYSKPVFAEWVTSTDSWAIGYDGQLNWVLCSNVTQGLVYIFDIETSRWMVISAAHYGYATVSPSGRCVFWDSTNQPKYINPDSYKACIMSIQTPFSNCGMDETKYLYGYKVNYNGIIRVRMYGQMYRGQEPFLIDDRTIGTSSRTGTGTMANTTGQTAIVGSATAFTTELKMGDTVTVNSASYVVSYITDNTHLELKTAPSAGFSGKTFTYTRSSDLEEVRLQCNTPWVFISALIESSSTGCIIEPRMIILHDKREFV